MTERWTDGKKREGSACVRRERERERKREEDRTDGRSAEREDSRDESGENQHVEGARDETEGRR